MYAYLTTMEVIYVLISIILRKIILLNRYLLRNWSYLGWNGKL